MKNHANRSLRGVVGVDTSTAATTTTTSTTAMTTKSGSASLSVSSEDSPTMRARWGRMRGVSVDVASFDKRREMLVASSIMTSTTSMPGSGKNGENLRRLKRYLRPLLSQVFL